MTTYWLWNSAPSVVSEEKLPDPNSVGLLQDEEQPLYVHQDSPLIQSGHLVLNPDGSINPASAAVLNQQVLLNSAGSVDLRSPAVASAHVYFTSPTNTSVYRRPMRSSEIEASWNKADTIPGLNPQLYRQDAMGNIIYYNSYGKRSAYGWDVDHSKPLSKDGTYHLNNLHALHAVQNRDVKRTIYPYRYQQEAPVGVTYVEPNQSNVDLRSSLVRSGALSFKPDGTVDQRCSAVRTGAVLLRNDGTIDMRSSAVRSDQLLLKPSSSSSSSNADPLHSVIHSFSRLSTSSLSPSPVPAPYTYTYTYVAPSSVEAAVDHRSALVRGDALLFTQSGAVDRRSSAVRSGEVLLTQSGQIDGRSSAVRRESLLLCSPPSSSSSSSYSSPGPLKSDGTPDMRYSSNRSSGGGSNSSGRSSGGGGGRSSGGGGGGRSGGGRR